MARTGLIANIAPDLERFLNRHVLGVDVAPDYWPKPRDISTLPIPNGFDIADDAGSGWILAREYHDGWPKRRTAVGAHGYRFAHNREFDCGWRLVDCAARLIRANMESDFACVTILPPANVFRANEILPWLAVRLAGELNTAFIPDLFTAVCPLAVHPDVARHLRVPSTNVFVLNDQSPVHLGGARVLLLDWRYHSGRTLRALAGLMRRRGAEVTRLVWLK